MVVEFISQNQPEYVSTSCKAVCCATQSKWLVQAQPENKYLVRTTIPIILPPFSTTTIKGSTKLRRDGMRLNLVAEPSDCTPLPSSVQCAPTYCILQPGSNRVAVGLKMFQLKPSRYHPRLLWVNYNKPGWYLMIRPPNLSRIPLGERGILYFRSTEFGGIGKLDRGAAAISQGLIG